MSRHSGNRGRLRGAVSPLVVAAAVIALCLGIFLSMCGAPGGDVQTTHGTPAPGVFGTPEPAGPPQAALGFGLTHTQYSADQGGDGALAAARDVLSARSLPQDQAIMGWGADNPEPSPGRYDFDALDSRIALIRSTGGTPVLTLCCSPDWMKGGRPDTTDWSRLEEAPSPAHYADFAALAAKVAERYPDVTHFMVWNEFKGFWDNAADRWDYQDYTRLYNMVYRAIKKVAPHDMVGGPYINMDSLPPGDRTDASSVKGPWGSVDQRDLTALEYWLKNKAGADFLVVDGSSTDHDDRALPDPFTATEKFSAVGQWLREHGDGLPVWWAEWYVEPDSASWPQQQVLALQADAMTRLVESGAATAFYWNPETPSGACSGCLWRGTEGGGGAGTALPMMDLLRRFATVFPPGVALRPVSVSDARVRVLGSANGVVAVNTTDKPLTVQVNGAQVRLAGYGVDWLPG